MIIIVNNSCKPIDKTIWNLKVKYIMEKLIGKQKVMYKYQKKTHIIQLMNGGLRY